MDEWIKGVVYYSEEKRRERRGGEGKRGKEITDLNTPEKEKSKIQEEE